MKLIVFDKLKEVMQDCNFAMSLLEMASGAQIVSALQGRGVDITYDELYSMARFSADGEMDLDMLDHVAGGVSLESCMAVANCMDHDYWCQLAARLDRI